MPDIEIVFHPEVKLHNVSRYLYGSFAEHLGRCIYEGIWVGEDSAIENNQGIRCDTVEVLKRLKIPVLRWPGGCFADNYHWMDGVGPRDKRPTRINIWWNQQDTNHFGTEEFMRFCNLIDTEPYICLNMGSGTVEEARSWVEYCNSELDTSLVQQRRQNGSIEPYDVKFWGVGNENWVCGGNMRHQYYVDLYKRFATYVKRTGGEDIKLIACGSHQNIPEWDERFLEAIRDKLLLLDYIALHIYSGNRSSDIDFSEQDYYDLITSIDVMDKNIARACELAEAYSTYGHPIGVIMDEWGTWYKQATVDSGLYQQNTMRDAIFAAVTFHCFHKHGQKLFMTNMAQTINVLQSFILTDGPAMVLTPTYYVYEMLIPHRDNQLISANLLNCPSSKLNDEKEIDALSISATTDSEKNELFLSLVNIDLVHQYKIKIKDDKNYKYEILELRCLKAEDIHDYNSFEEPTKVTPMKINVENSNTVTIPPHSLTTISMKIQN